MYEMKPSPIGDVFHMVRKDHSFIKKILFISILTNLILVILVFFFKEPKIKIVRMYDNPLLNETISLEETSDKIRKQDILLLVKFIIEHMDFKSPNTLSNYEKLISISEDKMLSNLKEIEQTIVSANPEYQAVHNAVENTDIVFNKSQNLFIVSVKYTKIIILKDGSTREAVKQIKLALKPVDRKKYEHNLNLGGWYYGLMLSEMNIPISDI